MTQLPNLRLRLVFGSDRILGPGKAELLEGIKATGSIAAAGRGMGMSYKRAWLLVEALNSMFHTPLIASTRGGAGGGHASLTPLGEAVLERYREIEAETLRANHTALTELVSWMRGEDGEAPPQQKS